MKSSKPEKDPDDFWQEYEKKTGEKILARSLGQYVSGWAEFDSQGWTELWGLIIATSGGFRFHHFPQKNWLESIMRNHKEPKEKTIFIPGEKIISARFIEERWWKKILKYSLSRLSILYMNETGEEKQLLLEADLQRGDLVGSLTAKPEELPGSQESAATAAPNRDACSTGAMT
jgi:hypothetical protein